MATDFNQSPFDLIDQSVREILTKKWSGPCEAAFEFLSINYPAQLIRLMKLARLEAADLTFAAEIVGDVHDHSAVLSILLPLLEHDEAVVREGAVYGLSKHLDGTVREALGRIAEIDPSCVVRRAAIDVLELL